MYMVRLKLMVGLKHWLITTYYIQYCQILPVIQKKDSSLVVIGRRIWRGINSRSVNIYLVLRGLLAIRHISF